MFIIGRALLFAAFYAAVGCLALKIAYKVVFREYSMDIGEAFKYMFGVGLVSYVALLIAVAVTVASNSPGPPALTALIVGIGVNYLGTVWVLMRYEGLILGQALGISLITTGLFTGEIFALAYIIANGT